MTRSLLRSLCAAALVAGASLPATAQCQLPIDECGTMVQGVTCSPLWQANSGGLYILDNTGGFQVGDVVRVAGTIDPFDFRASFEEPFVSDAAYYLRVGQRKQVDNYPVFAWSSPIWVSRRAE